MKLLDIVGLSESVTLAHSVLRLVTYDPFMLVPLTSHLLEHASSALRSDFSLLLHCERNEFLYLFSFPLDQTTKVGEKLYFKKLVRHIHFLIIWSKYKGYWGHGCLSVVSVVCCPVEVSATQ